MQKQKSSTKSPLILVAVLAVTGLIVGVFVSPLLGGRVQICIDPGHSTGGPSSKIDPATGLDVTDSSGESGESDAMWELAQKVKVRLEQAGFTVRLTKESADSYTDLRARADIGNTCSIMVRLHCDAAFQAILHPGEGQYKAHGGRRVDVDTAVARSSNELALAMFPFLKNVGIPSVRDEMGGNSNNDGTAYVGSALSRVPVVLIENNPSMVRNNPTGQNQVADAITQGIEAYFHSL
jgi:N-acetylmuramoyl-L-alanine amidase